MLNSMPKNFKQELSMLSELGLEPYELEYLIDVKQRREVQISSD